MNALGRRPSRALGPLQRLPSLPLTWGRIRLFGDKRGTSGTSTLTAWDFPLSLLFTAHNVFLYCQTASVGRYGPHLLAAQHYRKVSLSAPST